MSKLFALFIFSAILFFNLYSNNSTLGAIVAVTPTLTPTPNPPSASVGIELDRDAVSPKCSPGERPMEGRICGDGMFIEVTVSSNFENDWSVFRYSVSGGRIIGEGAKVTWDLTGWQPGTYTIKVDVEDELKTRNRTETKTVTVFENDCCHGDCFCPEILVNAQTSPVQAGETLIFTVNVRGGSAADITYDWTISSGKIIEGQGTPIIKIATDSKMAGSVVKATINFGGNAFCGDLCVQTFSAESFVVAKNRKKK